MDFLVLDGQTWTNKHEQMFTISDKTVIWDFTGIPGKLGCITIKGDI